MKKRIKIKSILKALIIILVIGLGIYYLLNSHIKNIYVKGNDIVSEQEIIDLAGISKYPKRKQINYQKMKESILTNKLIHEVKISLSISNKLTIEVVENKPLFYDDVSKKIILSDGNKVENKYSFVGLPILTKEVDEEVYSRFIKAFNKVDSSVLNKISEVNYDPSELDKDRFLLYMNDQLYVYVTLTKIENLNNYNELVVKLEDKKGILYLDSGNYFQIKENGEKEEVTTE